MAGKFPNFNWSEDNYANWLRQNAVNLNLGVGSGIAQMLVGTFNPSPSGFISNETSGLEKIINNIKENYIHSLEPNSAKGNVNGGDINVSRNKNGFFFYQMCIKREYAEIIDNYFSMYGYKVNEVKIPNIEGRRNWNYVKLLNPNVEGTNIPEFELNEFKKQLENGITFWHNPATFRDYSQDNSIV